MAQSGFTPILCYASGTASNVPLAANLTSSASGAELALNYADGKLFYKDSGGVVQVLATKATGSIGGSTTQVQYNLSGALAGSANMTFNGTRLTVADLADSGLTSGRVVYASAGGALVDSANLTFDGTTLTANALTTTSTVTINGGTANGVAYLNGSKVLTTGSALTFDGTNFGIGTSSPSFNLDIGNTSATSNFTQRIVSGASYAAMARYDLSGTGTFTVGFNNSGSVVNNAPSGAASLWMQQNYPLVFGINGSEQMRLTSTGLGIGTSSPASQLTVGAATANPAATVSFFKSTTSEYRLKLTSSGFNADGAWLGLGFGYSDNYMKAAIIAEAKDGNGRANFHFALNDAASSANASLSDSKMVLTYTGNLGLGVTPSAWATLRGLQNGRANLVGYVSNAEGAWLTNNAFFDGSWKYQTSSQATMYQQLSGVQSWHVAGSGTANDPITFTQAMTLDASGNLLVGTTSGNDGQIKVDGTLNGSNCAVWAKSAGGSASPTYVAWNNGTTGDNKFVEFYTETSATVRGSITYNRTGGLVAYNTTSDYRAKDIIGPVQDPGATIDALKVYEGQMKGATQSRPMLVAHEAQEHAPYAVTGAKDAVNDDGTPKYQQMDVSSLVPLLLAELQSLRRRVAQLEGNQP
jgi:hypothetical protein